MHFISRAFFGLIPLVLSCHHAAAQVDATKPNPMRPTTITWGGYANNKQLVGADDQWPFVQKYMDGFVMHGAYWISHASSSGHVTDQEINAGLDALGHALQKYGKTANVETGLSEAVKSYDPSDPSKRAAVKTAQKDIACFKQFESHGVKVSKMRIDWFPTVAMAVYAEKFHTFSPRELLLRVTGADAYWGTVPGFDPREANWRENISLVHAAFPDIEFGFDGPPCNFFALPPDPEIRKLVPWPAFGYGYKKLSDSPRDTNPILGADGKPYSFNIDFADLLMSVALSTRDLGMKFSGFEADTPYNYVSFNKGRMKSDLMPFLLQIERLQHQYGFKSAKMINDSFKDLTDDHDTWDKKYHDRSLEFLETYQAWGGRADQYIFESWYAGPYTFFPETKDGTFSNLARDAIRRVRGIDDQGNPFHADLAIRRQGELNFAGTQVYQTKPEGVQAVRYTVQPGTGSIEFELQIENDGRELNKGDCRATPLLRAEQSGAADWKITYRTPEGKDVTTEVLAGKNFDGWFVGGLEPGEKKTLLVSAQPVPQLASTRPATINFQLYWNPQDPEELVRDAVAVTVAVN